MSLSQLQAEFAQYLQGGAFNTRRHALSGPFATEQLLQIYRNNFQISLQDYLNACFPVTQALVGDQFFTYLSKTFIAQQPLKQAQLEAYGAHFPDHIPSLAEAQSVPYLADVARLEWRLDKASNQAVVQPFPHRQFQMLTAPAQARAVFELAETSHVLSSDYPVLSIWHGVQSGELDHIDMNTGETLLIHTETPGRSNAMPLNKDEQVLIAAIQAGAAIADLPLMTDGILNEALQQSLSQWLAHGIINNFVTETHTPGALGDVQ